MKDIIKILIVEDSSVVRDFLVYILSSEPDMHVVGTAKNGKEAIMLAALKKPDIITMDIEMPVMNGMEATREIMSTNAIPIIIVTSSYSKSEISKTFKAIEAGALAILAKPAGFKHPNFHKDKNDLIKTVRLMSEIKVVTRRKKYLNQETTEKTIAIPKSFNERETNYKLTAIGVSTGGPQVLNTILPLIPEDYKLPIVIVQHIPEGFLEGMVDWLNKSSRIPIKIAIGGEKLEPRNIYFCPAESHIGIKSDLTVELKKDVPGLSIRPSVSYLFRSIAKNFNHESIGILLTGMGKDGAEELAIMKEKGALTIIQDEKSSIVFGMPGAAFNLDAHKYILSPVEIANKLIELNQHK